MIFETDYASAAAADLLGALPGETTPSCSSPASCAEEAQKRRELLARPPRGEFEVADTVRRPLAERGPRARSQLLERPLRVGDPARALRPPGHPRRAADRGRARARAACRRGEVIDELNISDDELREDIDVLNVVNFGGGTYVLYAEIVGDEIEVDPETYGDNFARPARLLPLEAKALVAAIDLFGDHLPQTGPADRAQEDRRCARPRPLRRRGSRSRPGATTPRSCAPSTTRSAPGACSRSSTTRRTRTSSPTREVEPYQLVNGPEGWYLGCLRPGSARRLRHFRLDRIKEATITEREFEPRPGVEEMLAEQEWLVHGEVATRRCRPRLGLARACSLAARGADRGRGALRRRGRGRAPLRLAATGSRARSSRASATSSSSSPRTPARRSLKVVT